MMIRMKFPGSIPARLGELRERAGLSIREMAQKVGMSASGYGHYENEDRFKADYLPQAQAILFANILSQYGVDRAEVMRLAGIDTSTAVAVRDEDAEPGSDMISVYNVQAAAGLSRFNEDEFVVEKLSFPPNYLRHITKAPIENLAIIGVKGDSMLPTLKDDDLVMVDTTKDELSWGGIYVLRVDGQGVLVKRISMGSQRDYVKIRSDNPLFPEVERHKRDVEVVGRVIWYGVKV